MLSNSTLRRRLLFHNAGAGELASTDVSMTDPDASVYHFPDSPDKVGYVSPDTGHIYPDTGHSYTPSNWLYISDTVVYHFPDSPDKVGHT